MRTQLPHWERVPRESNPHACNYLELTPESFVNQIAFFLLSLSSFFCTGRYPNACTKVLYIFFLSSSVGNRSSPLTWNTYFTSLMDIPPFLYMFMCYWLYYLPLFWLYSLPVILFFSLSLVLYLYINAKS